MNKSREQAIIPDKGLRASSNYEAQRQRNPFQWVLQIGHRIHSVGSLPNRSSFAALLCALGLWLSCVTTTQAATVTVTTTADSGPGSLRQAVINAANGDTIVFATSLSGATIDVNSVIALNKNLTIDGSALPVAVRLQGGSGHGHFTVGAAATVTLIGLTLTDGGGNYGGALYNGGTLTLDRITLADNSALGGGAIYNVGTVTLRNSTVSGNSAFSGGGIDNYGTVTLQNSTVSGNSANNTGGGLYNAGSLSLYNTILANSGSGEDCYNANDPFFGLEGEILANVRTLAADGTCDTALRGDPQLAPLAMVGGALIHLPAAGSPVVDAGDSATCLAGDQRNLARPQGSGCDLGAVELVATVTFVAGDCNGDQVVDAGDLAAAVLEIFDGDGSTPANVAGGTFAGTPGCDANNDVLIDAGDLACTVLTIFNGPGACHTTLRPENGATHPAP